MSGAPRYLFGQSELNTATFQLLVDGEVRPVEPKALDVLRLLLERAPAVVDKQEIFATVWKDVAVTDNALTRIIAQLRKALDDDAKDPRYIATVSTRGYRMVTPVAIHNAPLEPVTARPLPSANASAIAESKVSTFPMRAAAAAFLAIVVVASVIVAWSRVRGERQTDTSISKGDVATLAALKPVQMTTGSGFEGFLSFSPDGTSIAFSSDRSGALEVYVQGLSEGSKTTALTANGRQNVQPVWSPDGRFIAYHEMAGGGIWLVPSGGGAARQVTTFGSHPSWSSDSHRLVFQSDALVEFNPGGSFGATSTIWTVSVEGRAEPVPVTKPNAPTGAHGMPVWWPSGQRIIFAVSADWSNSTPPSLWTVNADGSALMRLIADDRVTPEFAIAPDGRSLLFSARNTHGIWRLPLTESGSVERPAEPTGLPVTGTALSHIAISRDGRRIAWTANETNATLWSADATHRAAPLIAKDTVGWRAGYPTVSDDGRVAFLGNRGNAVNQIFLAADDGAPRQLTTDAAEHGGPFWLEGDREIAVVADHGDGPAYWALDPDTGHERALLRLADLKPPPDVDAQVKGPAAGLAFTHDASHLAVAYLQQNVPNIWTIAVSKHGPVGAFVQRTFETVGGSFAVWSPDGRWFAYECEDKTSTHTCIVGADGSGRRQLTNSPGHNFIGGWLPDNDQILVAARRNAVWNIVSVSRTSASEHAITAFTEPRFYVRYPRWDAAHKRVVFERFESNARLWSVELPSSREGSSH